MGRRRSTRVFEQLGIADSLSLRGLAILHDGESDGKSRRSSDGTAVQQQHAHLEPINIDTDPLRWRPR